MKLTPNLFRFLGIAALVAIGAVYARDPDCQCWPLSHFGPATAAQTTWSRVISADWTSDGQKLLIRFHDGETFRARLAVHELAPGGTCTEIDVADESAASAAVAPDGRHLFVGSWEGRLWWIDLDSRETPVRLAGMESKNVFTSMAISDDGLLLAAGSTGGLIHLYDLGRDSSVVWTLAAKSTIGDLRFSRDGRRLVAAQNDGRARVWNVATGELQQELAGHTEVVMAAAFLSDDQRIISASLDDTVRIWDIALGREVWCGEFHLGGVNALDLSPDGTTAAWGGHGQKIIVWDLERGHQKWEIATKVPTSYLKFSPDGTTLAAVGYEEIVRLYNVQTGKETTRDGGIW
ncbi:MAG TPA: hypothetical protein VGM05_08700 [Planctomycetaceae bacterium]|jgi:WD40 repeat protein